MSTVHIEFFRSIPKSVSYDLDLPPLAHHLLIMIAHEIYLDTGKVQMTVEYLAKISRMSIRNVLRYTPILEQRGYILVHRASKGSKIPNVYEIIGILREVMLPKRLRDRAVRPEAHLPQGQVTNRQSMAAPHESSTLNSRVLESHLSSESAAIDSQPDIPDSQIGTQSTSIESSDQVTQWQTTKQEGQKSTYKEENVVEPFKETPVFRIEGVSPETMQRWADEFGITALRDAIDAVGRQKNVASKGGWVYSALRNNWDVKPRKQKETRSKEIHHYTAEHYIGGEYGAFVDH